MKDWIHIMAYDPTDEAEEATGLLALARKTYEAHIAAAREKAEAIVTHAEAEAANILDQAREEFRSLEAKITQHREFEARYRSALESYLSELLAEIRQDDEFIAPASAEAVVETVAEHSVFEVESEVAPEPLLEEPEIVETTIVEEVIEELVEEPTLAPELAFEEPVEDEQQFEAYEAEEPAQPENVDAGEEFEQAVTEPVQLVEQDEFVYETPAGDVDDEPAPLFAEGEAPVPAPQVATEEPEVYDFYSAVTDTQYVNDPSDDLPPVPDSLDSYGSMANEIEALEDAVQGVQLEDAVPSFDELIEPKPATEAISTQSPVFEQVDEHEVEDADKGVRSFFGFKKN